MNIEHLKDLIKAYDDGMMLQGEFTARAFHILLEDDLIATKDGYSAGWAIPCKCRPIRTHKNDYQELDLHIHPHGFFISPKGSFWQRLKKAFNPKSKWITISGGC